MKVTQMPPVHAANLVANSGNTAYGVDVIKKRWDYLDIPSVVLERLKDPPALLKVCTILEKDPNPHPLNKEGNFRKKVHI